MPRGLATGAELRCGTGSEADRRRVPKRGVDGVPDCQDCGGCRSRGVDGCRIAKIAVSEPKLHKSKGASTQTGRLPAVVLATYNIKGGVGKTSASVNLAYLAARGGASTLLWDLDPQGAASYLLRIKAKVKGGGRRLVQGKTDAAPRIKGTDYPHLDLLPADFSYRHMDLHLDATKRPMRRLAKVLAPLGESYDYVFLDCPPSVSLVSESVFKTADALLIPLLPATLSARTLEQIEQVAAGGPRQLPFFSMVDTRKRMHREVMQNIAAEHPEVLHTAIPLAADVERMGSRRAVLEEFAPAGRAAGAFRELWEEIQIRLADSGVGSADGSDTR